VQRRRSPVRAARVFHLTLLFTAGLCLPLACGADDETAPPRPPGPIAVAIDELRPRGGDYWRPGDPEPVVVGCDRRLGVTVVFYDPEVYDPDRPPGAGGDTGFGDPDWLLRPPDACSGRKQCGTIAVSVEPLAGGTRVTGAAALQTVLVDLAPLGAALDGRVRIRAELLDDGETPATKDGLPLADELEVELRSEECPTGGEAGAGGAPSGTGGTSGTSGTGNAGGLGGAPATGGAAGSAGTAGAGAGSGGTAGAGGEGVGGA
jgi:hypothetical protein